MKTKSIFKIFLALAFALPFLACQKEKLEVAAEIGEEEVIADGVWGELLGETDDVGSLLHFNSYLNANLKSDPIYDAKNRPPSSGQRIVTIEQIPGNSQWQGFPKKITIQFINWQIGQGPIKNGFVFIVLNGPIDRPGTSRVVTTQDFTVGGNLVEGTKTVARIDQTNWQITLAGGKITFEDGTFATRNMTRNRKWVAGTLTPFFIWDDEFEITGNTNGTRRNGASYTATITKPILVKMACKWFVSGTKEMVSNNNTVILDYGDGECDNIATVTVNGETREITIRPRPRPKP